MSSTTHTDAQPRSSVAGRFLFWCAGADPRMMGDSRIERFRYLGVGSSVLLTACAATFAMVLFVRLSVPGPLIRDIALGAFWGLFVFTLDRWLVSSVHYGPLTVGNTGRDPGGAKRYVGALGRLVMSFFLASLISGPIILALFGPEVNEQLNVTQTAARSDAAAAIGDRQDFAGRRSAIAVALRRAEDTEKSSTDAATRAQQALDDEISGKGGTGRKGCDMRPGVGVCWQKTQTVQTTRAAAQAAHSRADAARSKAGSDTARLQSDIDAAVGASNQAVDGSGGSLARESALFQVLDAHPALWVRWGLINGLFLLVDLMPVLLKMFGPATVHDRNVRLEAVRQAETADLDRALQKAATEADHKVRREAIDAQLGTRQCALDADHRVQREVIEADRAVRSKEIELDRELRMMRAERAHRDAMDRTPGQASAPIPAPRPHRPSPPLATTRPQSPYEKDRLVLNGRWEIERPLSEADHGGFGDVYLARDLNDRISTQREGTEK